MSSFHCYRAIAATAFFLVAFGGATANAQETCVIARSSAGPMLIQSKAFGRARDRLTTAAHNAEAQIRRAHAANGFVAGAVRYGRIALDCFRPNPQQFRVKCEGVQTVCVSYTKTRDCPANQYYSAVARRCVTLR